MLYFEDITNIGNNALYFGSGLLTSQKLSISQLKEPTDFKHKICHKICDYKYSRCILNKFKKYFDMFILDY